MREFRDGPKSRDVPKSSLALIQQARPEVEARTLSHLDELLSEIGERRAREGANKTQWLDDSFGLLIRGSDSRKHELSQRVRAGERHLQGLISMKEQRQRRLVRECQERLQTVDAEIRLTIVKPERETV